jgi:hypothetical protein
MTDRESDSSNSPADFADLASFCQLVAGSIGPDREAISRFISKDGATFDRIETRLNELLVLLEEIATTDQFGDPAVLAERLRIIYASIDALGKVVLDVKQRLLTLEKEVERRKPNKFLGFFKKKDAATPFDFGTVKFETDELFEKYNLVVPSDAPVEPE